MAASHHVVGVLGGMGPLATVDFMQKIIHATPASRDQDHVPLIVHAIPQIPDRATAVLSGRDDPFPALLHGLETLEQAGAGLVVIPCNTAHAWFDRLAAMTGVPMLHIADAVRADLERSAGTVGLMATEATVRAGFYQRYLTEADRTVLVPSPGIQATITETIGLVKAGDRDAATALMAAACRDMLDLGAQRLLLACTELPIAIEGTGHESVALDATACLARACVAWSCGTYGHQPPPAPLGRDGQEAA